jgi:hypothetical protein
MNAPASLGKVEQIRARDGDACWLCDRPLDFSAVANSKNAPTIEHLVAKSLGGGGELANLALCHKACNLHLADRPLAKKQEMRAKFHANAARLMAAKTGASKPSVAPKPTGKPATASLVAETRIHAAPASQPVATRSEMAAEIAYWRRLALIGGGGGLVSAGFAVGLGVGLLLS